MRLYRTGGMTCTHAQYRDGKPCESFAAPSLWCNACWPRLAAERKINHRLWPEREAVWPVATALERQRPA